MEKRELKFRAWDARQGKMFRIDELRWRNVGTPAEQLETQMMAASNFIIMQYTGLKDKNGKEIFEGDIVRIEHPYSGRTWQGVVVWKDYQFTGDGFYFPHFEAPSMLFSEGTQYIEIIGNLYENPELLKERP